MPLSDFFKRSPKKEPPQTHQKESVKPSIREESLLSPEMQKKQYNAAIGVVEGAKTSPPQPKPERSRPASTIQRETQSDQLFDLIASIARNSTDGVGNRLVIGEGMTAMGEALRNGGRYILVHPEVLNQLKTNSVDAFLIYAAALHMETASKIPQIDFVGANVDQLLQQWSEKPENHAPIHVRQVLWLMNHAQNLGYERRGDSWVLQ